MANNNGNGKSLESWIWNAACSIRGAKDAPKYKDFILPLIFTKRLCDVFDEAISTKRLGLDDVEADIIGKSYEYLIRKFAEGGGQSAGEFYTPPEVGIIMSRVLAPEPGMEIYDPCCGSGGLLVKCEIAMEKAVHLQDKSKKPAPLKLYGQEYISETWAMANMNMIIHDMEGEIEIGDTFKNPKFRKNGKLRTFDRVIVIFLDNAKPKARQGKVLLVNAGQIFEKGDPKNFIPDIGIARITDTLIGWKEEEKLSRIVDHAELKKNDYNISPSRYIHTSDAETYRPIAEIVEELKVIEDEAKKTDKALRKILKQLGV